MLSLLEVLDVLEELVKIQHMITEESGRLLDEDNLDGARALHSVFDKVDNLSKELMSQYKRNKEITEHLRGLSNEK